MLAGSSPRPTNPITGKLRSRPDDELDYSTMIGPIIRCRLRFSPGEYCCYNEMMKYNTVLVRVIVVNIMSIMMMVWQVMIVLQMLVMMVMMIMLISVVLPIRPD